MVADEPAAEFGSGTPGPIPGIGRRRPPHHCV